jgi:hypothetical protein
MKNLKHLRIYEAFESQTLSKVFNYVNKAQKNHFKQVLENLCDKLNFPMSKLTDDLFQYLPFNKALALSYNIEDEPCKVESETIPGEFCSGPTGDDNQGQVFRTWGRGRRKVECPVCRGTGIKPKTEFPIKWIKFWFTKDGKYVTSTAVDGQIRAQGSTYKGGSLDTNQDNYEVEKTGVRWNDLNDYGNGDFFLFADGSNNGSGVAMLWKSGGQNFMLQNFASGSEPSGSDWRKVARYSWVVTSSGDVRGTMTKLKLKGQSEIEEEKKPDPYTWNAQLLLRSSPAIGRNIDMKEELKDAHFALILDYVKMKEITESPEFKSTITTRKQRQESRVDAAALKLPNDIKAENYERYIQKISKSIKVTSDITSIRNIFMRILGLQYAGHYILQGLNFGELDNVMEKIIGLILTYEKSIEEPESENWQSIIKVKSDSISSNMKDTMEASVRYNRNIKNNLDYLYTNSPSPEHTKVIDKIIQVNKVICDKIRNTQLESIEDAVIFYGKIRRMREDFKESALFKQAMKASDVNYYLESNDEDRCLRMLNRISGSDIDGILKNFDQYINYINKL